MCSLKKMPYLCAQNQTTNRMKENLVIVESPAKAKTIEKFLGDKYKVLSSYGHIRDLKKKSFSVDEKTFAPQYEVPADKVKVVDLLRDRQCRQRWCGSHPMKTAREKPSAGTFMKCSASSLRTPVASSSTKSRSLPFWMP